MTVEVYGVSEPHESCALALSTEIRSGQFGVVMDAWARGQVDSQRAWDILKNENLWPELDELMRLLCLGFDAAKTMDDLRSAPPRFVRPLLAYLESGMERGELSTASFQHLCELLPSGTQGDAV